MFIHTTNFYIFQNVFTIYNSETIISMRDNYGGVLKPESIIKKEARGIDNTDLGKIKEITSDCIITQKDTINNDKFIIPKNLNDFMKIIYYFK